MLNELLATDVQLPLPAVTVQLVPAVMPLIAPPAPALGPAGVNVYVKVLSQFVTVAVPAAEHVAAAVDTIGVDGTIGATNV